MELSVHIPEESRPKRVGNKVPVKWDGFEIGSGFVSSDGTIVIIRLNDTTVSREIQSKISSGMTDYLSINPRNTEH